MKKAGESTQEGVNWACSREGVRPVVWVGARERVAGLEAVVRLCVGQVRGLCFILTK